MATFTQTILWCAWHCLTADLHQSGSTVSVEGLGEIHVWSQAVIKETADTEVLHMVVLAAGVEHSASLNSKDATAEPQTLEQGCHHSQ